MYGHELKAEDAYDVIKGIVGADPRWKPIRTIGMREPTRAAFYETLSEAGPLAVNGRPTFFSVKMLNESDQAKLHERVLVLDALLRGRKSEAAQRGECS